LKQDKDNYKRIKITLHSQKYQAMWINAVNNKTSVAGIVRSLIFECLEDEEDIREGKKALKEKDNAMDWGTFKRSL
jgi:hypothetical protein